MESLLTLQQHEAHKLNLEAQLTLVPKEVAKAQARISEEEAAIKAKRTALKQIEVERVDVDNEMQSLEAKVVKYKTQQMEVKKNEEYQALTHEIEGLQVRIGELEEREIELLVKFDDETQLANSAEVEHREQISIFEKEIARLQAQEADVKAQIGQATADVESAREAVPTDWLKAYQRAHQRRPRPQWVVPMQDQHCGGCHLKVSAEVEGQVLTDKEPAFCDSCGRMLYKP